MHQFYSFSNWLFFSNRGEFLLPTICRGFKPQLIYIRQNLFDIFMSDFLFDFSVYLHLYLSPKVLCCTVCTVGIQRIHLNRNNNSVSFSKSTNFNASRPNYSSEALTNYEVRNILPHVRRVQRFGRPFSKTNPIHFNTSCRVVACTGLSFVVLACCKRRHENLWDKRICET